MRSKPMILVALLLPAFLINLDTTLVNVALPALARELHATTTQLQWVVDSYNLVFAALLLTFGSLTVGCLVAGAVAAAGALLAVLFLPAQPVQPIQITPPASPAADEPATAEAAHEAETQAHPASAAR